MYMGRRRASTRSSRHDFDRRLTWQQIVPLYGLPFLWVIAVSLMMMCAAKDPFDPSLVGTAAYGHNQEGALWKGIVVTFAELVVAMGVLRPWSFYNSRWRTVTALLLFVPLSIFSLFLTMHAGSIIAVHFSWLAAINVFLLGMLISTTAKRATERMHRQFARRRL